MFIDNLNSIDCEFSNFSPLYFRGTPRGLCEGGMTEVTINI